jgi:peptidase S41-like protein
MNSLVLAALSLLPAAPPAQMAGSVRTVDGKPIAGALVAVLGSTQTQTDSDGKYTLSMPIPRGEFLAVQTIIISAKGYVPFEDTFLRDDLRIAGGATQSRDFVLATGPNIAGKVDVPLPILDKLKKVNAAERVWTLEVRGPSFKGRYRTEPGGAFEVTVPASGNYSMTLLDRPFVGADEIKAGSKGVTLVPREPPIDPAKLEAAFDAFAVDFARNYSYFELKKIDWPSLRAKGRLKCIAAGSEYAFADALAEMLIECRDGHIWIDRAGDQIPTLFQTWTPNFNRKATLAALGSRIPCGDFAIVGKTLEGNYGALILMKQSAADRGSVREATDLFNRMRGAPGYVIDLRYADGGDESLARDIAELFCEKDTVYARSRFRNGPGLGDFGPPQNRILKGRPEALTQPIVVLVGPGAVSSGEGFVKMLKALPQATLVGQPTRGSSGNPRPFKLPGLELTVWYSRWMDLEPDGSPVEGRGIAPQVLVNEPPEAYRDRDPTWEKAMEVMKEKTKN